MNAWNEGGGGDPHWANSNLGGMTCQMYCTNIDIKKTVKLVLVNIKYH